MATKSTPASQAKNRKQKSSAEPMPVNISSDEIHGSRTRAQTFFQTFFGLLSLWTTALVSIKSFPEKYHLFIYAAPLIIAFVAGVLAVLNIAYHLATFKECPEAYNELLEDIKDAKAELSRRGVNLDA